MRVLVTGAAGFVGKWLKPELESAGHFVVALPADVDVRDAASVRDAFAASAPDAVAHLAAVSFAPDAAGDPQGALDIATTGTINVIEAFRRLQTPSALLVSGSADVYGTPLPDELPLTETSPLRPESPYALSKAAQEAAVLALASRYGLHAVVTRSFNHTGPGQRPDFVVPALAQRILAFAKGEAPDVPVGNLDVRRDISDVRDVVRAYRLLLEALSQKRIPPGGAVFNVSSGRSVNIRDIADALGRLAGVEPEYRVDPEFVRENDPLDIRGDSTRLHELTDWTVEWTLERTLATIWDDISAAGPEPPIG
jgi:GDP-4-dehydro-6-deoxy-D-mannose reductase